MRHIALAPATALALGCVASAAVDTAALTQAAEAAPVLGSAPLRTSPESARAPFALMELFTSEGCSSCPPADALAAELALKAAAGARVFVLGFHVDYWDGLGWADPSGSPAFSARQRAWNDAKGWGVYTPQWVVQGAQAFVGSDASKALRSAGAALAQTPSVAVDLEVARRPDGRALVLRYASEGAPADAVVLAALSDWQRSSAVKAGENRAKVLDHAQVVRALEQRALPPGGAGSVELPLPGEGQGGALSATVWVTERAGSVLGANRLSFQLKDTGAEHVPRGAD